ncbi:hypothetical protein [Bacterioplanes sanyensis]|uniref:hypothetical protein n=1 Tax=Bacterioplanes sanyensis TaxID=1249553 RepID=UPI0012FE196E|nr:hypothetical protein [Bacterioplanes sanyensis]
MSERTLKSLLNALSRPCVMARIVKAEWLAVGVLSLWCGGLLLASLHSVMG